MWITSSDHLVSAVTSIVPSRSGFKEYESVEKPCGHKSSYLRKNCRKLAFDAALLLACGVRTSSSMDVEEALAIVLEGGDRDLSLSKLISDGSLLSSSL